eukprot:1677567-Pyramimonas_sp.AAC.1
MARKFSSGGEFQFRQPDRSIDDKVGWSGPATCARIQVRATTNEGSSGVEIVDELLVGPKEKLNA